MHLREIREVCVRTSARGAAAETVMQHTLNYVCLRTVRVRRRRAAFAVRSSLIICGGGLCASERAQISIKPLRIAPRHRSD